MQERIDLRGFSPSSSEEYEAWFNEEMRGGVLSPHGLLASAAASTAAHAYREANNLVATWVRFQEKLRISLGEYWFVQGINYKNNAVGPLLSATILPAFALEAFAKLVGEIAIPNVAGPQKSLDVVALAVSALDSLPAPERLAYAARLVGIPELPKGIVESCKELIDFRNSVAHGSPELVVAVGDVRRFKRGKLSSAAQRKGRFPDVLTGEHPVGPQHVTAAIDTHDEFVAHIHQHADPTFLKLLKRRHRGMPSMIRESILGFEWSVVPKVEEGWSAYSTFIRDLPEEELSNFFATLNRRSIKVSPAGDTPA